MKTYKQLSEELKLSERYDSDLDANKNGKLDSDDFKRLRNKKKKSDCNEDSQLDEISSDLKQRAKIAAKQKMSDIEAKYPPNNTGCVANIKGITPEDKAEWTKRNKQTTAFNGVKWKKPVETDRGYGSGRYQGD